MPPLKRGETFATGMVRPKTTALFFDKLWVHPALIQGFVPEHYYAFRNDLESHRVPAELCVNEPMGIAEYYDSWATQKAYTRFESYADVSEALRHLNAETWDLDAIFEIEAVQHFGEKATPLWEELRERFPLTPPDFVDWAKDGELYLSTHQRNKAIAFIVQLYEAKGIQLTPIYLTAQEHDEVTVQESPGLAVVLDYIPTPVDARLTWDQVSEFRQDRKSVQKLNRLRRWFTLDLAKMSESEIKATLEKKLDDYQYALKKHGIETVLAGATSILSFSAGPTATALLTSSPLAALASGIVVASGAVAWIGNKLIERSKLKRDEMAYIYDVQKLVAQ
jgi:hypothetical protein